MKAYSLSATEFLEPDIRKYATFNDFFSRRLRADARIADAKGDQSVVVSVADSRLTVWDSVKDAKKVW